MIKQSSMLCDGTSYFSDSLFVFSNLATPQKRNRQLIYKM